MGRSTTSAEGEPLSYNADRCRATRRLRTRLVALTDRVEALEAELTSAREEIAAEREALTAHLDSPEARLALLQEAQALLQSSMIDAVMRHEQCSTCGGLGKGMTQNLLKDDIAKHCAAHGLSPDSRQDVPWPHIGAGRSRNKSWLDKPKPRRQAAIW